MKEVPGKSRDGSSCEKMSGFVTALVHPFISYANTLHEKEGGLSTESFDRFLQQRFSAYLGEVGGRVVFEEMQTIISEPRLFSEKLMAAVVSRKEIPGKRLKARIFQYFNQLPLWMRHRLRRAGDPLGRSVPEALRENNTASLVHLLPKTVPQFLPGDRPVPGSSLELVDFLHSDRLMETWTAKHTDRPHMPLVAVEFFNTGDSSAGFRRTIAELDRISAALDPTDLSMGVKGVFLGNEPPCREVEFFAGEGLEKLWWSRCAKKQWSAGESFTLGLALARLLGKAHQLDVVHGDLNPSHIRYCKGSGLRVDRFGLQINLAAPGSRSSFVYPRVTNEALSMVSSPYSSVQVLNGETPGIRDDIYSLGVIWFQLCLGDMTAHPDPAGRWRKKLAERGIDPKLIHVIGNCVEDARENRPASIQAILDIFVEQKPKPAEIKPKPKPKPRPVLVAEEASPEWDQQEFRPDIFISYRKAASGDFAFRLHKLLKARGYSVFYDDESLKSGNWGSTLRRMVADSRDFLLVLSPNTFKSKEEEKDDWVVNEIDEAIRSSTGKTLKIIPVYHDAGSIDEITLPARYEELRKIQSIVFNTKKEKVFEAIFETDLVPALKSRPANYKEWFFSWFSREKKQKTKKKKNKNNGLFFRAGLFLLLIGAPFIILLLVLYQPAREEMAKILPAAGSLFNRGMAKVLPSGIGTGSFRFPDVQMYASTPILDYKAGWKLLAKDTVNDLERFEHVVGCNDGQVLITTRIEVLEYQANSPGKIVLKHRENWNECDQILNLFFNSNEEPVAFSYKHTGSNFLKITPSGVRRFPIREEVAYNPTFLKHDANLFGCHSRSEVYLFDGDKITKKSAKPNLPFEKQALELLPDYAGQAQKSMAEMKQMWGFKLLWIYYPGFYGGSVHVNQNEVRVLDSSGRIESVRYESDRFTGEAAFAFGSSLQDFCLVTKTGQVFKRNSGKMDKIVNSLPGLSIKDLWVSPSGKVYAISDKGLYILE